MPPGTAARSDAEAVVEANALEKSYGTFRAVAGIEFRIRRGECFGFLGPNGAGKTSTMKMIQAVSSPSGGRLSVLGRDPVADGKFVRSRLGVCPQSDNLDPDLTVWQNLMIYGRYFCQEPAKTQARASHLLEFFSLNEKKERAINELSGGMKRRLVIARALINEPELLLLDEPTTGLDPQARHLIWQKLRLLREDGVSMALTTHYMDEAERLCDRLVIMDHGKILAEGTPRQLIADHVGHEVFELDTEGQRGDELLAGLDVSRLKQVRSGDMLALFLQHKSELGDALVERARAHSAHYRLRNATLEDVFLELTGRELVE
jgi:lipooligosaccharide transport system ATP-binding protein